MAYFFFSSRRRHTRCGRDWSSDVCSSDLEGQAAPLGKTPLASQLTESVRWPVRCATTRSEERRVGKECRSRWSAYHYKEKNDKALDLSTDGTDRVSHYEHESTVNGGRADN